MILALSLALASPVSECADAEREGRFAEMLAACACEARFCAARSDWLRERLDTDGGVDALTALDGARRGLETHPEVWLDDGRTSATVRAEIALWLAQREPERAVDLLQTARAEAPDAQRRQIELALAEALARAGKTEAAEAIEAPHRLGPTRPSPVQALRRRRTRAAVAGVALVMVAGFVLSALRGTTVRPWGAVPLAVLVVGGALYATAYAEGAGAALWLFLPGVLALHLLAARSLTADPRAWRRVAAAAATLAWGYLSLWWVDGLLEVGL